MNKNKILILFLLTLFFVSLSSVSANVNDTQVNADEDNPILNVMGNDISCGDEDTAILSSADDDVLTGEDIIVSEGDSIQKAIDNASAGSTIIVEKGTYSEDLVISKGISIIGKDAILNSKDTSFNILQTANKTSISGFEIVVSNIDGTGIFINASDCTIADNRISGGNMGIFSEYYISNSTGGIEIKVINNTSILRNRISDVSGGGISIASFNPTVSGNNVTNVVNRRVNGTAIGIRANGMGIIADDLKVVVTDNRISNVRSYNESAYGLDVGGNSVFDTLVQFDVSGNSVKNVAAAVESYGANIGVFSLNTTLPTVRIHDLNIKDISSNHENSSVVGLGVSVTTIGQNETSDTIVTDISIKNLKASGKNAKATGIDATGVGCTDIYVTGNDIDNVRASASATGISATGIEYTNFNAFISVENNNIGNFNSPTIKGINLMSLGNGEINKNLLYNLPGRGTTFITGVTLSIGSNSTNISIPQNATIEDIEEFIKELGDNIGNISIEINGNLTVIGNNLEGTGAETGFAVVRPSEIHYNRAVNLKYNVIKESTRKFILESYGYDPDMSNEELAYILLKSQEMFENCTEEELRNMSVSLGKFLDKTFADFDKETSGDVDAKYNWWGSNSKPSRSKFKNNNGSVIYDPWLVLRVSSNPHKINKGEYSKITADVYTDSNGADHSSKAKMYFSGPKVTLTTDKGSFEGKKSVTLNWTNGKAVSYLKGDETGLANVTAYDYDIASTTVLIGGKGHDDKIVHAKSGAETMHPTGNPLVLLLAAVIILSSLGMYPKR